VSKGASGTKSRRSGRCPRWVKRRNTRCEHIESALPLKADSSRTSPEVRFVPATDITQLPSRAVNQPLIAKLRASPAPSIDLDAVPGAHVIAFAGAMSAL
jgi:hypothetical protein